uniref:Uncharacterized protein n=1 Tax=Anguilla anguilla TaxID=7936 RepID=A0A0E9R9D4_ANGAN
MALGLNTVHLAGWLAVWFATHLASRLNGRIASISGIL